MINPYQKFKQPIQSYCIFADILGYSHEVCEASKKSNDHRHFKHLYNTIQEATRPLLNLDSSQETEDESSLICRTFSDNIFLAYPLHNARDKHAESELGRTIDLISSFQMTMSLEGFFIRGGWTLDEVYIDDTLIYGTGIINSYNLESKLAIFPRIIVQERVKDLIYNQMRYYSYPKRSPQSRNFLSDTEGDVFVDYLSSLLIEQDRTMALYLVRHKHQILVKMRRASILSDLSTRNRAIDKYLWLVDYHNYFCNRYLSDEYEYHQCYIRDHQTKYQFLTLDEIV